MAAQSQSPELEKLREEVAHWKAMYEEQLRKTQTLERRLRGETEEQKPLTPNQRRVKSNQSKPKETEPAVKQDTERERVKNKLRLACSQNDASLLQEAIAEAERLGMPEVDYARKKLATISTS